MVLEQAKIDATIWEDRSIRKLKKASEKSQVVTGKSVVDLEVKRREGPDWQKNEDMTLPTFGQR